MSTTTTTVQTPKQAICKIHVETQYHENYSDTDKPYWKPKGAHQFIFPVYDEQLFNFSGKSDRDAVIDIMLERESNDHCRYTRICHEVKFFEPNVVEGWDKEMLKHIKKIHTK